MTVLMKFSLALVSLLTLSVIVLGNAYSFNFPQIIDYKGSIILVALFGSLAVIYTYVRPEKLISPPCWSITIYSLFIPTSVMLTQIVGSFNFPLTDKYLAEFDQMLGFNWPSAITAFSELPEWVSNASTSLYGSSIHITVLVTLFLIFTRQNRRLDEFVTLFIMTGIITIIISGFAPAESAYEYFKLNAAVYDRLSPIVGHGYMNDFYSLRDGSLRELKVIETQGIISFPSFHTINSLLLIYVIRKSRYFFVPVAIWNIGIIITTPFDGAHYIADVLGGTVLFALMVFLMRWLEPHLTKLFERTSNNENLVPVPQ